MGWSVGDDIKVNKIFPSENNLGIAFYEVRIAKGQCFLRSDVTIIIYTFLGIAFSQNKDLHLLHNIDHLKISHN